MVYDEAKSASFGSLSLVPLGGAVINSSAVVRDLEVLITNNLLMNDGAYQPARWFVFYQLRHITNSSHALLHETMKILLNCFMISRVYFCNYRVAGVTSFNIRQASMSPQCGRETESRSLTTSCR